jgi:hypothetical protein
MSPEMLRLGTKRAVDGASIPRGNVLPIQIDFSTRNNIEEIAKLLRLIVGDEPILYSLLGNTLSNFEDDEELLSNIAFLLRPQDQLLLEIATTDRISVDAAAAAANEYDQSERFKHFVSSSLVQNTNLPVEIDNVHFLHEVEGDRALLVKTIYRNSDQTFKMRVGNNTSVKFGTGDTIRLSTIRKYSPAGISSLLSGAGLRVITTAQRQHPVPSKKSARFGNVLMLLKSGEKPVNTDSKWDFFIAYAAPDIAAAEQIYDSLTKRDARVFFDKKSIRLGASWDENLCEAQVRSRVTVVLISRHTSKAYYEREEIAAAIALARRDDTKHQVVPLFVGEEGDSSEISVPYGLRLKHSADLRGSDLESIITLLMECLRND